LRTLSTSKRNLPCKLTDTEVQTKGTELAKAFKEIEAEEEHQKSVRSDMKAKLDGMNLSASNLSTQITERIEYRDVDVDFVLDETEQVVKTVRSDTGETVDVRQATQDELQADFLKILYKNG
jgi:hypothetical protein